MTVVLEALTHDASEQTMARRRSITRSHKFQGTESDVKFDWLPVIREFQNLIENDDQIHYGFQQMFEQSFDKSSGLGRSTAIDYIEMLDQINTGIQTPPRYTQNDYVGCHIYAVLDRVMCTSSGLATLAQPRVNAQFKRIFDVWATFLSSPRSRATLTTEDDGWFGPLANAHMPGFEETFVCDPSAPYRGFTCWDDYFTRSFRPGVRPVKGLRDNSIINSGCESTVYCISKGVKYQDNFWLKGQAYSLRDMLHDDPFTKQFVGGTVLQCFLSATSYHRWHSPINGRVVKTRMIPGIYFTQSPSTATASMPPSPISSQAFLTAVSTRALVFIESDNPQIGLICFMAVGMIDVSTCDIRVKAGDRLTKGQEMGMFHFGGSTYCMLFRPGTRIGLECAVGDKVPLNSSIATVS